MSKEIALSMVDGVRVVVPDSLELLTPYVLQEQLDWFEPEIKFLRGALQPGQRAIDIGANYGVFTLSMARTVGPTGKVWAFEPANATANYLEKSISANRFDHVDLQRRALSNRVGTTQFMVGENAELNSIARVGADVAGTIETVQVGTLDDCLGALGWRHIDFIKIDAEGEEANILEGGQAFFQDNSPLVQFEVKISGDADLSIVSLFADMGYESYVLVPGLNLLSPFHAEPNLDEYLLNLFACKPDRAETLSRLGALATRNELRNMENQVQAVLAVARANPSYGWRRSLASLPFAKSLKTLWEQGMDVVEDGELGDALSLHGMSRDNKVHPARRLTALFGGLARIERLMRRAPTFRTRSSYARMASEAGQRSKAVDALHIMIEQAHKGCELDMTEPFLPPCGRFDGLPLGATPGNWAWCAMNEQYERLCSHSSFYLTESTIARLQRLQQLGFLGPDMQRRLNVARRRLVKK